MNWRTPLGLYQPGTSLVHRAPVGIKLLSLASLGLAVAFLRGPGSAAAAAVVVLALAAHTRLPLRRTARGLLPLVIASAAIVVFHTLSGQWAHGLEIALDLLTLVLASFVLTATTPLDQLLDLLARLVRPLRRVGLDPDAFALAVAVMLRGIPAIGQSVEQSLEAARARGLERSPRAILVPVAVRAVGRAQATGDALAARGIGEGMHAR